MALLARQMGLNLSNNATMNTLAGALAGNLPLGNLGGNTNAGLNLQNLGLGNLGLQSLASNLGNLNNLGGVGGMASQNQGNMGQGNMGGNMGQGNMGQGNMGQGNMGQGNMGGNMGGQSNMGPSQNMNMGSNMGLSSGSGLSMALNAPSGMDNMRPRGPTGPGNFGSGPQTGNYGSGSNMPLPVRNDNTSVMARGPGNAGPVSGSALGNSDTIVIQNLPLDCNWQVSNKTF